MSVIDLSKQRAIVLQLLRDDHEDRWTDAELREQFGECVPALIQLEGEGAVIRDGRDRRVSSCVRHLDSLGLVAI